MTAIQDSIRNLALAARVAVDLGGMSPEDAADLVARNAIKDAAAAAGRTGIWAREATSEQIEAILFQGSVARDAIEGNSRPSVGNVWNALLNAITD